MSAPKAAAVRVATDDGGEKDDGEESADDDQEVEGSWGESYTVNVRRGTCSCPSRSKAGAWCKHLQKLSGAKTAPSVLSSAGAAPKVSVVFGGCAVFDCAF